MLSLKMFCEIYDVGYKNIMSRKSLCTLPDYLFEKQQGLIYIHEDKLERRHNFRDMVHKYCQTFYYVLSEHLDDKDISALVCSYRNSSETSMYVFINEKLFKEISSSYICYQIYTRMWITFRCFREIERKLKRVYPEFNPEDLLEKRYKEK